MTSVTVDSVASVTVDSVASVTVDSVGPVLSVCPSLSVASVPELPSEASVDSSDDSVLTSVL